MSTAIIYPMKTTARNNNTQENIFFKQPIPLNMYTQKPPL